MKRRDTPLPSVTCRGCPIVFTPTRKAPPGKEQLYHSGPCRTRAWRRERPAYDKRRRKEKLEAERAKDRREWFNACYEMGRAFAGEPPRTWGEEIAATATELDRLEFEARHGGVYIKNISVPSY